MPRKFHAIKYVRVSTNRLIKTGREFQTPLTEPVQLDLQSKESAENANDSDESDESPHSFLPDIRNEVQPNIDSQHRQEEATRPLEKRPTLPKKRDVIKYRESGSENWKEATVVSRADKATGKFLSWLNITSKEDDKHTCLDFNNVEEWSKIDDNATEQENATPVEEHQSSDVIDAKKQEMQNWKTFKESF